jgi:hypothetical protein
MTDTTTTTRPATQARRTPARPQLSVRPVAAGAANAATIAGATIAAAGGGLALAATAAGAAGVAAIAGSRSKSKAKANRETTGRIFGGGGGGGRGATSGGPARPGRSSAATPGRTPGSKPSPGPRAAGGRAGGRPAAGGGGSRAAGGGGRNPAGGPAGGAKPGGRTRGGPGGGGGGYRPAGSQPGSRKRSPLTADKVAAARRRLANRRMPGPRLSDAVRDATGATPAGKKPTPREAFANARRAVTGSNPKRRGPLRRATAGVLAGGIAAAKVWRSQRTRKRKEAAARAAKQARIQARRDGRVATAVRTTDTRVAVARTIRPAPAPIPKRATDPTPTAPKTNTEGLITMAHPMLALSQDYLDAAIRHQPEGMLQVAADAHVLPAILENFAKAMKVGFDRAMEQPLHPAIKDLYKQVHTAQLAVQRAAEEIGPQIERVHEHELHRLRNPRHNEEMWDRTRNRGVA